MKFNLLFEDGTKIADTTSQEFCEKWREKEIEALKKHYGANYKITIKHKKD